ncbi:uncharacterized protein LOC132729259 isoform X1 [Ruditapes philippinarum]|uniref:uncharacterized protein LOC132729259 isoform X1 n=1 Tax=Ruditapes philippinarum TaxID=129788 RepID=UPI00295B2DF4|nr:uncharacterized protein LOC132729259 isoform X1 [Ruditapes philippinarum]
MRSFLSYYDELLYRAKMSNIVISNSSSDEENPGASGNSNASPTGITETHTLESCKYDRYVDTTEEGIEVIIHVRFCNCSSDYVDKSYLAQEKMDFIAMDGKDIHFDQACKWHRFSSQQCGKTVYILKQYCSGCNTQTKSDASHAMNMVTPSN